MTPQLANSLRLLLAMLGAYLASKGKITQGSESQFADYAVNLLGAAISLGSLFSAWRGARKDAARLNAALALPAYSTPFDLNAAARASANGGWRDYLIRQAILTVLSILSDDLRRTAFARYLLELRDELNAAFPASQPADDSHA